MSKTRRKWPWIVLAMLCIVAIPVLYRAFATLRGEAVEGRVVDAQTGKPIAGAVVYAIWEGARTTWVRSDSYCVWADSVRPDARGHFHLAAWSKHDSDSADISNIGRYLYGYAPGYEITLATDDRNSDLRMKPFAGTLDERFGQLRVVPCVPSHMEHRVAIVYGMMADEMERTAVTNDQVGQAHVVREEARFAEDQLPE